jgi:hypothetical protein
MMFRRAIDGLVVSNFVVATVLLPCAAASAQAPAAAVREVHAARAQSIVIDGKLNEEAWQHAVPASEFIQRDPDEGKPATEPTEVRVLYDDHAIYVGIRLLDDHPDQITRRLARRDTTPDADWVMVYLDPQHDHLTGFEFGVSAAGEQYDGVLFNDTSDDSSWDGVWESAVSVDEKGWSVELRIPLSQLRYQAGEHQTWGINLQRFVRRKNEYSWLVMVPKKESGLASRMAHLVDLDGIPKASHLELLPYAVSRGEFITPPAAGDPFNDGSRMFAGAGLDAKWGAGSSLTVDATINPDFGQVEVDPAVVNLTAFETFYEEKRPFFIEGAQIFGQFGRGGANSFWGFNNSEPTLFYSRRIGREPQGETDATFVDRPGSTTIVGAAKITGKTSGGWSFGVLDAFTSAESARLSDGTREWSEEIEPPSNYLVARVKRDLPRGGFGLLATDVERDLRTPALGDLLVNRASVAGADGYVFLDAARNWVITGGMAASHVSGSTAAITRLQTSPQRYDQRPDAPEVSLDPTATSMSGWYGRVNLNRNAGSWIVNAALWGVSPGFESNDLGYHTQGDAAGGHGVFGLRKLNPDRLTRSRSLYVAKYWTWNFNREVQADGWFVMGSATLKNYWSLNGNASWHRSAFDQTLTRGGPSMRVPSGGSMTAGISTDSRRPVGLSLNGAYAWNAAGGSGSDVSVSLTFKPSSKLLLSTGPEVARTDALAQYVERVDDPTAVATYGARYVFSNLHQTEVSMVTRVDLVLTPTVSFQLYVQPLISVGRYWNLKELAAPRTFDFLVYGTGGSTITPIAGERAFTVDPDGSGPAAPFRLDDPSFNFKSLRANAIFRWQFRPGSTLFVVWTEQRQDSSRPGEFELGPDIRSMLSARPDDVVLVKISYWFGR